MFNLFKQTYKLNNSIFTNTIIYQIRSLPLINKIVSNKLYGNEGISAFVSIITLLINIAKILGGRILFLFAVALFSTQAFDGNPNVNFIICFSLLSIYGAFYNNKVLMATKDKYYAIVLMRIDANKFAKLTYISEMITLLITSLISFVIFSFIFKISLSAFLLAFIFIVPCKTIGLYTSLKIYQCEKSDLILKPVFNMIAFIVIIACILGFILLKIPYLYIYIGVVLISILFAVCCIPYIMKSNYFNVIYKKRLTINNIIFDHSKNIEIHTKKLVNKKIKLDENYHSNKQGYDNFNDIFITRHKMILTNLVNKFAAAYALLIIITICSLFFFPQMKVGLGNLILMKLASISFVMYFTNKGDTITRAMFINCDSSMLHYRFYRRPKDILALFKLRLKSIVILNLRPALVLAIGILIILFLSEASYNPIHYISIFIFIIALSVFFSVHHLILYYLLQPYNINMQAKGFLYSFISSLTYALCYISIQLTIDTFIFSIIVSLFCIIYIIVALKIAYKYAHKTFRIKQ